MFLRITKFKFSLNENMKEFPYNPVQLFLDFHEISVYPPKILPIFDFTIERVGPF